MKKVTPQNDQLDLIDLKNISFQAITCVNVCATISINYIFNKGNL